MVDLVLIATLGSAGGEKRRKQAGVERQPHCRRAVVLEYSKSPVEKKHEPTSSLSHTGVP